MTGYCQGFDTGYDEEPGTQEIRDLGGIDFLEMDFSPVEIRMLAHGFSSMGVSLTEAANALGQLVVVFAEPEHEKLKNLMMNLELTLLPAAHDDLWLIRRDWENQPRTRIRPSRTRIRPLEYRVRPYRNRQMLDSRSGLKGKTIRKRLGKFK